MAKANLTAQRLRELFDYDPMVGSFVRRIAVGRHGRHRAGTIAGVETRGYISICVDRTRFFAHRLAWLYMTGEWPANMLDHINCNRSDNRFHNLRLADPAVNSQNQRSPRSDNTSGFLGVTFDKGTKRWRAKLKANGRYHHLGGFDTPEEAHAAYIEAKRRLHIGCTL